MKCIFVWLYVLIITTTNVVHTFNKCTLLFWQFDFFVSLVLWIQWRRTTKSEDAFNVKRCTTWFKKYTTADEPDVLGPEGMERFCKDIAVDPENVVMLGKLLCVNRIISIAVTNSLFLVCSFGLQNERTAYGFLFISRMAEWPIRHPMRHNWQATNEIGLFE